MSSALLLLNNKFSNLPVSLGHNFIDGRVCLCTSVQKQILYFNIKLRFMKRG